MSTVVGISPELWAEARKHSRIDQRSMSGQIEYWAWRNWIVVKRPSTVWIDDNENLSVRFICLAHSI
jgi:hypothetical protein